ncbi:MAG: hypothetical protein CMN60_21130 [Sphingobium sp.]|nr:hypothetical protein [Sphingobium sp.]MBS50135.1 hypothetical protein [Sphingobium sp.]|tara:strand:- start:255140 stop:255913 length:774 start_codon:yes stop_codon:yes gene_type:complete
MNIQKHKLLILNLGNLNHFDPSPMVCWAGDRTFWYIRYLHFYAGKVDQGSVIRRNFENKAYTISRLMTNTRMSGDSFPTWGTVAQTAPKNEIGISNKLAFGTIIKAVQLLDEEYGSQQFKRACRIARQEVAYSTLISRLETKINGYYDYDQINYDLCSWTFLNRTKHAHLAADIISGCTEFIDFIFDAGLEYTGNFCSDIVDFGADGGWTIQLELARQKLDAVIEEAILILKKERVALIEDLVENKFAILTELPYNI